MARLNEIIERTPVKFPGNKTVVLVENGRVIKIYDSEASFTKDGYSFDQVVEAPRPQSTALIKYNDEDTVYGRIDGFYIPYRSPEEFEQSEGAESWNNIKVRDSALRYSDGLNQQILEWYAPTMARVGSVPESLADFDKWVHENAVYEQDGEILTGDAAFRAIARDHFADYRTKEINRFKEAFNLSEEQAQLRFNEELRVNRTEYERALESYGLSMGRLREDLAIARQRSETDQTRLDEDFRGAVTDLDREYAYGVEARDESFAERGLFDREAMQGQGQHGKDLSRYTEAFKLSKQRLESQYGRSLEDIVFQREGAERQAQRGLTDIDRSSQFAREDQAASNQYMTEAERLRQQQANMQKDQGLEGVGQQYDTQQEQYAQGLRAEEQGRFNLARDETYAPDFDIRTF